MTPRVPAGVQNLSSYQRKWLRKDIVAGLVLTALLVPQGMAYAELAGLPAITGLYTSILCLLGYALFGPSRILVLGPDSSLGPMIAATILPMIGADGDPSGRSRWRSMLALMVGAIITAAGIAKLGFIADLISKPTMIGYMNGLALTILVGQLPKLFGFSVDADGFIDELTGFVEGVADGETVPAALAVGLFGLAPDPGPAALAAQGPRRARRGRALDRRGRGLRPRRPRRRPGRHAAAGFPAADHPRRRARPTSALLVGGRARHRPGLARRHDLHRVVVRRPQRPGGRRPPGDDRHRRREPRRRALPGLPGQHQRLPHRGGRAGRRQDAGDRAGRRGGDHADPAVLPGPAPEPARSRRSPRS